ncbi:hypothetical protein Neosp_005489 [[Neocosmospora] mangrovei]
MVKIDKFAVEELETPWANIYPLLGMKWMAAVCKYDISETCCASISLEQLAEFCDDKSKKIIDPARQLIYGPVRGSEALRTNLSKFYSPEYISPSNIVVATGTIGANHLSFYSLLHPGDHVIVHYPTYQQLYAVPPSLGAEVDLWEAKPENNWIPSIDELKALIKPNTKMIVINNPNNPSGAVLKRSFLQQIIDVAAQRDIIIHSDEIYRPLFHSLPSGDDMPPSIVDMGYKNVVATGSLSKAWSLAGIRIGWVASPNQEIIEWCLSVRYYTNLAVSQVDDQIATFTLDPSTKPALIARNIKLAQTNLAIMEDWVKRHASIASWVKPQAGTTAFIKLERDGKPIHAAWLCERLYYETSVMLLPGDTTFGDRFKGYIRIGYVQATDILVGGLKLLEGFLRKEFNTLPLADDPVELKDFKPTSEPFRVRKEAN